jgi:uncharacterized protein YjiS (DUF1127 family)
MYRTTDLPVQCLPAQCLHDDSRTGHGIPLSGLAMVMERLNRWWKNRRAMNVLKEMDAHQLDDIGLSPSDIYQALCRPTLSDPMNSLIAARRNPLRGRRHA